MFWFEFFLGVSGSGSVAARPPLALVSILLSAYCVHICPVCSRAGSCFGA